MAHSPARPQEPSIGRFIWYELSTTDLAAAKTFYAAVVGWAVGDAAVPGTAYSLFNAGETSVGGAMQLPEAAKRMGAKPIWIGYVGVDDVEAAVSRLKSLGGAVYVPPTDIPDIGRFAVVADPQMATLALIKRRNPGAEPPAAPGSPGHVGWRELLAADGAKAFAFYRALFGWQNIEADVGARGTYQLFGTAGEAIGGMSTKPPAMPGAFWLYYFNVDDIDAAAERVSAGGGQILEGPIDAAGGSRIARCMDPQGAMFALAGRRGDKPIGYFESTDANHPAAARFFVPR
jgi:uncharacterized protein